MTNPDWCSHARASSRSKLLQCCRIEIQPQTWPLEQGELPVLHGQSLLGKRFRPRDARSAGCQDGSMQGPARLHEGLGPAKALRPRLAAEAIRLRHLSGHLFASYGSRMLLMETSSESLAGAFSCEPYGRLKEIPLN